MQQMQTPQRPDAAGFLDVTKIQQMSNSKVDGKDVNNVNYTIHRDLLQYTPKKADIPKELERYIIGSENPDVSGCSGEYDGLPTKMEERMGFLGIMEMGPTQLIDKNVDMFVDYNETPEFFDVSKIDNKPTSSAGPESFNAQSMKEMRRSKMK